MFDLEFYVNIFKNGDQTHIEYIKHDYYDGYDYEENTIYIINGNRIVAIKFDAEIEVEELPFHPDMENKSYVLVAPDDSKKIIQDRKIISDCSDDVITTIVDGKCHYMLPCDKLLVVS